MIKKLDAHNQFFNWVIYFNGKLDNLINSVPQCTSGCNLHIAKKDVARFFFLLNGGFAVIIVTLFFLAFHCKY